MNPKQFSVYDIINASNPAQKILWNAIYLRFGDHLAISQFYYCGRSAAANEFQIFTARRLYVCYLLNANAYPNSTSNSVWREVELYDENNVLFYEMTNGSALYNTVVPSLQTITSWILHENFYFSELNTATFDWWLKIIGFRVTY